jgi:hypothetical protein
MYKKLIVVGFMLVSLLASCGKSPSSVGGDGYYFEKETLTRTDLALHVVLVKDQAEMTQLLKEHGRQPVAGNEVAAFSTYSPVEPRCTIYMIDPKLSYQPEFIGHELVHCVYGNWHTVQP